MTQLNRDPNTVPHTLPQDSAAQNGRSPYAAGSVNEQLSQPEQAFFSYCKVKREPKLGPFPIVVTVVEGVLITLLIASAGVKLLTAVFIGAFFGGMFAFIFWIAKRQQTAAAKRFVSYLDADGGQAMFTDFASAQPFADDQFRLGRQYLFIKNTAVLRLDSIYDIVRIRTHYRYVPTGVYLHVKVKDEHGKFGFLLCRVHMLNASAEIAEIRSAVLQGRG